MVSQENRPALIIDLSGPDGNVLAVIEKAKSLIRKELGKEIAEDFAAKLDTEVHKNLDADYNHALNFINEYVEIVDVSGSY